MTLNNGSLLPSKVAIVHEWFTPRSVGGAEQVVQVIDELLLKLGSDTTLYSLVDAQSQIPGNWLSAREIKTSFIQNLPFGRSSIQKYLPLLPFAIEQFDLDDYPLVISSSHLVAKGILTSPGQLHVSYIHTPVRYAWDQMNVYLEKSSFKKYGLDIFIRLQLHLLRQWDQLSAQRVDHLIANSRFTAKRISKFWGRKAEVIHPPVNVQRFSWNMPREDVYLCLSRLVPNKRVDLVVKAFNQLQLPLLVVGEGPEKKYLHKIAESNVKLLGRLNQTQVEDLMSKCRAFVYAGVEDFGIAPVEAMAAGAPVIAFRKGGLLDTVRSFGEVPNNPTGLFFDDQTVASLVEAVSWFEQRKLWQEFSQEEIRLWAERFSPEKFSSRFHKALSNVWTKHSLACDVASSDPDQFIEF